MPHPLASPAASSALAAARRIAAALLVLSCAGCAEGSFSGDAFPIHVDMSSGAVVVKVLERKDPTADEVKTGLDQAKAQLLNERRGRFYSSYMLKARDRMRVNVNRQLISQIIG